MNLLVAAGPVLIRPWQAGDEALLADAEDQLSLASLHARFFMGTSRLPRPYLRYVATAWSQGRWDAVLATREGRVVGWAEYGRSLDNPCEAHLGVLVADAWQHRGLGSRLVRALLERGVQDGVTALRADVLVFNRSARAMIRSLFGENAATRRDGEVLSYTLPLVPRPDGIASPADVVAGGPVLVPCG